MPFEIMSESCNQCLMTKNKIVSDARRKQILSHIEQTDGYFICHKASLAHREIACYGHFKATGGGKVGRMSKWLGTTKYVDPKTLERVPGPATSANA
jgi:hypothetical protein